MLSLRRGLLLTFGLLLPTSRSVAQVVAAPDTSRAQQTLFTARDAWIAVGFAGLTVAMFPLDRHMREHLRDHDAPINRFFDDAATGMEYITTPGSFIIGGSLWAIGTVTKHRGMQDLGWHGSEAVLMGSAITNLLKGTLGRARPDAEPDMRPSNFQFGEGFGTSSRQSFPSGHTTSAFAAAAAVTSEVNRMWPKYTWYVGPALYMGATLVGVSRMYHNRHWASDVALGAGIGTFSGLKVVRYSHAHPDNLFDRIMLRTTVAPDGRGGAYILLSAPAPR
jgi:membrane-associated phospholipid phosphatase